MGKKLCNTSATLSLSKQPVSGNLNWMSCFWVLVRLDQLFTALPVSQKFYISKITSGKHQINQEGLAIVIQEALETIVLDLQSCQKLTNGWMPYHIILQQLLFSNKFNTTIQSCDVPGTLNIHDVKQFGSKGKIFTVAATTTKC